MTIRPLARISSAKKPITRWPGSARQFTVRPTFLICCLNGRHFRPHSCRGCSSMPADEYPRVVIDLFSVARTKPMPRPLLVSVRRSYLAPSCNKGDVLHLRYLENITLLIIIALQRTSYPKPFKTQILQESLQAGLSLACATATTPSWFERGYLLIVMTKSRRCPIWFR